MKQTSGQRRHVDKGLKVGTVWGPSKERQDLKVEVGGFVFGGRR